MDYFIFIILLISLFNNFLSYELSEERIKKLDKIINSQMKDAKLKTVGFIITNSSKTIFQKIYGETEKANTKTPFILGSVSKSFTALALLKLNISLSQTLDKLDIKEFIKDEDAKDITISELLNHTSGLASFSANRIYEKGYYNYSNYGYALLGKIIEKKSEKSYKEYMQETIFQPLKMKNSNAEYKDDIVGSYDNFLGFVTKYGNLKSEINDGFFIPAGYISSSIGDMGEYLRYYLNKDPEVQNYIQQITKGNIEIEYNTKYGMGMMVTKKNNRTIFWHNGASASFLSHLSIYPELDISLFIITNTRDAFCGSPKNQFFNNIEDYLISDFYSAIDSSIFLLTHFTYDLIYLFINAIPLVYLIITIIRKIKVKKYSWFDGTKGIIIFCIDLIILVIMPVFSIIVLFAINADIRTPIMLIRDLQFVIFLFYSILFLIFIIKVVYIILYRKFLFKFDEGNIRKLSVMDINILDDDEKK